MAESRNAIEINEIINRAFEHYQAGRIQTSLNDVSHAINYGTNNPLAFHLRAVILSEITPSQAALDYVTALNLSEEGSPAWESILWSITFFLSEVIQSEKITLNQKTEIAACFDSNSSIKNARTQYREQQALLKLQKSTTTNSTSHIKTKLGGIQASPIPVITVIPAPVPTSVNLPQIHSYLPNLSLVNTDDFSRPASNEKNKADNKPTNQQNNSQQSTATNQMKFG